MINQYPLWKYILILMIVIPAMLYALPNIYGDDPGIQIRGARQLKTDTNTLGLVEQVLKSQGIATKSMALDDSGIAVRFNSAEDQLRAREALAEEPDLKDRYTTALSLMPATPKWLEGMGALPMYLGLDLRGGVHFLMEVDMDARFKDADQNSVNDARRFLREAKPPIRHRGVRALGGGGGIEIQLKDDADRAAATRILGQQLVGLELEETDRDGASMLIGRRTEEGKSEISESAIEQNVTALRNRVDELGVAEPVVQRQGLNRIVVQLPGVQDPGRAKRVLGQTATLEAKAVDEDHGVESAAGGSVPPGSKLYPQRHGGQILLKKTTIYAGKNITDAAASLDTMTGGPVVSINLDSEGAARMQRFSGENIGKRMAMVYIEQSSEVRKDREGKPVRGEDGRVIRDKREIQEVITAPVIRDQLGARFQIEGLDNVEEARDLALLLRAGSLAAPVDIIEERTVGPSLGQDNIRQGFRAVIIGFVLVLIFMIIYYRVFGGVACIALALNLVLIVAVLSLLQATLTLPGVAGIVLTVGMAVDANVLIFERIREELRNGNSPQASIHEGYDRALSTIVDANITTLIAAVVLFAFGTGPIKGFAVTLSIGILTSMFTAIFVTRGVVNLIYGGKRVKSLAI